MNYFKGVLGGLAAIFIAQLACTWPSLSGSRATGLAALVAMSVENLLSPIFWIVAIVLFWLFFTASRSRPTLRVLFFWIPTLLASTLGFAFVGMVTYLWISFRHQ